MSLLRLVHLHCTERTICHEMLTQPYHSLTPPPSDGGRHSPADGCGWGGFHVRLQMYMISHGLSKYYSAAPQLPNRNQNKYVEKPSFKGIASCEKLTG